MSAAPDQSPAIAPADLIPAGVSPAITPADVAARLATIEQLLRQAAVAAASAPPPPPPPPATPVIFSALQQQIMEQQARPLSVHLAEFRQTLVAKNDGEKHVKDAFRRVRLFLRLCRAARWRDLTPHVALQAMKKLQAIRPERTLAGGGGGKIQKARPSLGPSTVNHYLHSAKTFANWMVADYRADRSPLLSLRPYNERLDVRRARRQLSLDEVLRLITAAINGPAICGIPGYERAMMYEVAWTTGLRAAELQSLTRKSFVLDLPNGDDAAGGTAGGVGPHVVVEAAYSKHRRRDVVPIPALVVPDVRQYLAYCPRTEKLFRRPSNNGNYALRKDLAAAGVAYCVNGEYADFHSLRHTYVSDLFDSGATPKIVQTLARHQDPRLTLGRYGHVSPEAQRAAVDRLGVDRLGATRAAIAPAPIVAATPARNGATP